MGVQGLWQILHKAGQSRSLTHLAVVDGFEENESGRRAYWVGIDASIWCYHVSHVKGGKNPELRTLFFRLRRLAELPLVLLFVLDGPERPKIKRGSRVGKSGFHKLTAGLKKLLDIFGMEWRIARGEAEAELAYLNQTGVIDAVMTDDVDALVFGARTIIRNSSLNLSGNKAYPALNSAGKLSQHHVMVYTIDLIRTHSDVSLSRGGLILFALLSGGDYGNGLRGFGPQISHALARLGFGDTLLNAYQQHDQRDLFPFLAQWRADLNTELKTNARGLLRYSYPSLHIPDHFPNVQLLRSYVNPLNSASGGRQGGGALRDNAELNIPEAAAFCETYFDEWGYRSAIVKRFRDLIWEAAIIRIVRRAALEADKEEVAKRLKAGRGGVTIKGPLTPSRDDAFGTPSLFVNRYLNPSDVNCRTAVFVNGDNHASRPTHVHDSNLIKRVVGSRRHVSTDNILEYRVEVDPAQLVSLAHSGIRGKHAEPSGNVRNAGPAIKLPPDPRSIMKMWIPASMMRQVHPELVEDYNTGMEAKRTKTNVTRTHKKQQLEENEAAQEAKRIAGAGKRKRSPKHVNGDNEDTAPSEAPEPATKKRRYYPSAEPSSSHSTVSRSAFLRNVSVIIDLM
ncbi:PIN domain-like protein [Laetiporus sulphureus 93-53]|uniref:PIN domain-like protein n=1 Tax=Laetiporus sulphureus 93-53 TaxID=1314785 RepID=A0A165CZP0_9APHY|nr:PIN domain-like protein [Laetiporus sulphureus 93-53]KZT03833.1 PIN domain-like protein [Laetiporus sulphureus 93-53]